MLSLATSILYAITSRLSASPLSYRCYSVRSKDRMHKFLYNKPTEEAQRLNENFAVAHIMIRYFKQTILHSIQHSDLTKKNAQIIFRSDIKRRTFEFYQQKYRKLYLKRKYAQHILSYQCARLQVYLRFKCFMDLKQPEISKKIVCFFAKFLFAVCFVECLFSIKLL